VTNRTLAILALAAAVLTAALRLPGPSGPDSPPPVLPGGRGALPDSLRLDADGRNVTLRATGEDAWEGTNGPLDPARSRRIAALAHGLANLERGAVVARALPPEDLSRFGLGDPGRAVATWSRAGDARVAFGDPSPLPGEVYACVRTASSEEVDVFLLPRGLAVAIAELARDCAE